VSPKYAALAGLLALSACTSLARLTSGHVAQPGFECAVGTSSEDDVRIFWSLDESGRQVLASMDWREPHPDYSRPNLSIHWSVRGGAPLRAENGHAFIHWQQLPQRGLRPRLLRLEPTTDPGGAVWHEAPFAAPYESTGVRAIQANWPDLAAFARGASQLQVVLRDWARRIVDRATLDPALFTRAADEIAAALERMRAVNADFRNHCRHVDDIDPEIIVT